MAQTTTIQVQFGRDSTDASNAHLSAEIDSREDGLNKGDTSFDLGDTAWFLIFKSANVTIASITASAGSIGGGQSLNVERTEDVTFADSAESSLGVPAQSITSTTWLGANLGSLTLDADKQTVRAGSKGVGVARVKYVATATAHSLTSPISLNAVALTSFPILVLVIGNVTGSGT